MIGRLQIHYLPFQLQITEMTNYKRDSPPQSFSTRSEPAARSTMRANATTMKKNAIKPASVGRAEGERSFIAFFFPEPRYEALKGNGIDTPFSFTPHPLSIYITLI